MKQLKVGIVGSGPAGLMAAQKLVESGFGVTLFEKRRALGHKLLIAGSSGLNISNAAPLAEFAKSYQGGPPGLWEKLLSFFSPKNWLDFIEGLGLETFKGTSDRYFVKEMKAARLLKLWVEGLKAKGVLFHYAVECTDFETTSTGIQLKVKAAEGPETIYAFDAGVFALGGGSYEPTETPLRWIQIFQKKEIKFNSFKASNAGFGVAWAPGFLKESEGKPLKSISLTTHRGTRRGELMITSYGLEGTPIYTLGSPGVCQIDLKPDLTAAQILEKLKTSRENLNPLRRAKRSLNLSEEALSLLFFHTPKSVLGDLEAFASWIKAFKLELLQPRPLEEVISSSGGVMFEELSEGLMLHRFPGIFCAGEMLDWDAPTGGYLIQACVSQGAYVAQGVSRFLELSKKTAEI